MTRTMTQPTLSSMDLFTARQHEQLLMFHHAETGLRGAIALHSTRRGPALGGTRWRPYPTTEAGVLDVLRLSEAMTYKAAVAGLPLGGGKAVLFADGKEQDAPCRKERLLAYGRIIEGLGGAFITAEDANTTVDDMTIVRRMTRHVAGIAAAAGGGGDPSPVTAEGVLSGIRALAQEVLGCGALTNVPVAIQGLGKVGMALAGLLVAEGATVTACDVSVEAVEAARCTLGIGTVEPEAIYDVPCAIFAPCAYGGVLNDHTIPRLTCRIVAGSANNQLAEERHAEMLLVRGIVYAVDYVINAGGLVNVAAELAPGGYDAERARLGVAGIGETLRRLLARARAQGISTERAAHQMAMEALAEAALAPVRRAKSGRYVRQPARA